MARLTKAKAIERLQKALDAIPALKQIRSLREEPPEFRKWRRDIEVAITNTFGERSRHSKDFTNIRYRPQAIHTMNPNLEYYTAYVRGLGAAAAVLESMLEEIKEYWEDEKLTAPSSAVQEHERTNTTEVFVIHGRDNEAKETVARFLQKLDLTPIILHEQPNQGRTIIEKFEQHAQVGFAVALLTPDDIGALKNEEKKLKPRARQNVVFELGYFLGRLGREGVCALIKGNVEPPSDYDGVVYISLDDGGWKMNLIRELKNAGFEVDANRAL